jgi:Na+/melibiose symporter-like transporter
MTYSDRNHQTGDTAMGKEKAAYPLDFKTIFGVSTMGLSQIISQSLITTILMLYLTDYAGLYRGIAGKAAEVVAVMLLVCRLWDAISGPILGFIMDRSPRTRRGKFKPFMFWGTLASAVLIIVLFNIPAGLTDNTRVALMYVVYFVFNIAFNLLPINPLVQSLSKDASIRTKLLTGLRIVTTAAAITISFFIILATALGGKGGTPNFGLAVIVFVVPFTLISLLGIVFVKEGTGNENEAQVKVKDILTMFKANKPMLISTLAALLGGFVWVIVFGFIFYYIKYALGPENLGVNSLIIGAIILVGNLLGVFLSQQVQKRVTPGMSYLIANAVAVVPLAVLWVINLAGPISHPAVLYPLLFFSLLGIGMNFIPASLINMECMDYNQYKLGKSMEGTVSAISLFVSKLQTALSSAIIGAVLGTVGYNPAQYTNASTIPASLFSGLGFVLFAIPVLCGLLSNVIILFYPLIQQKKRDEMYAEIEKSKTGTVVPSAIAAD